MKTFFIVELIVVNVVALWCIVVCVADHYRMKRDRADGLTWIECQEGCEPPIRSQLAVTHHRIDGTKDVTYHTVVRVEEGRVAIRL